MSSFHQTNKWDLMVPTTDTTQDLKERAAAIVTQCVRSQEPVCVVMMHTPSTEQLTDLHNLATKLATRVALVGGQLGLMLQVVPALKKAGFKVVEAITDRVSIEEVQADGSVIKKSIFKHEGLRTL